MLCVHDGIITKAEKRQSIVILNTVDYKDKVLGFIRHNNIDFNPTNNVNTTIKNEVNKTQHILNKDKIKYLKIIKPQSP